MDSNSNNGLTPLAVIEAASAGARLWSETGVDITRTARTAFARQLPACGGDRAAAAAKAVNEVLDAPRGRRGDR
jgi:hypothetical protein